MATEQDQAVKLLEEFHNQFTEGKLTIKDVFELSNRVVDSIYQDIDNIVKEENIDKLSDQIQHFSNIFESIGNTDVIHEFPEIVNKIKEICVKCATRFQELSRDLDKFQQMKYKPLCDINKMYANTLYEIILFFNNETIDENLTSKFEELKKIHNHLDERTFGTHSFKFLGIEIVKFIEPILLPYEKSDNPKIKEVYLYITNIFNIIKTNEELRIAKLEQKKKYKYETEMFIYNRI